VKNPLSHLASPRTIRFARTAGRAFFLLAFVTSLARAADLPAPATLDLPYQADQPLPAWLGQPKIEDTTFATLSLPVLTPDTTASLLVTVYFQEKEGGFMRVSWSGTQGALILADNFYENIGMANQRSLLISPNTLMGDGILTFQCGDSALSIQRIKLEWLQNKNGLVSQQVRDTMVTPSNGVTVSTSALNGAPAPVEPAGWKNQIVTVPLSDGPVRIEQGVEFSIDLDNVPGSARVALQESGLLLGKHLAVWVNQQRAGTITPSVPELSDGGFLLGSGALTNYVGWRDGSFYVPVSFFKTGVNAIEFIDEDDATTKDSADTAGTPRTTDTETPIALKNITLQLKYLPPAQTSNSPQPQLLVTPLEPIPPDTSPTPSENVTP
jgi:hypothetical protein